MSEKLKGTVLGSYYGKSLVIADNKYFILKGQNAVDSEVSFAEGDALPMPSYMFGMAALNEQDLDSALDYIHKKWYKNK